MFKWILRFIFTTAVAGSILGCKSMEPFDATSNLSSQNDEILTFTTNLVDKHAYEGQSISFSVVIEGKSNLKFIWYHNGTVISDAPDASELKIDNISVAHAGEYLVVIKDNQDTYSSKTSTLTVSKNDTSVAPSILVQPTSQAIYEGDTLVLQVSASGLPAPTYIWSKNGSDLSGQNSDTLRIVNSKQSDSGAYRVAVKNSVGTVFSTTVTVTVSAKLVAPQITKQPLAKTVLEGDMLTLMVAANGNPTPTYTWKKNGVTISGATSNIFKIINTMKSDGGSYQAVVSNSKGSVTSNSVIVTISAKTVAPQIQSQPLSQVVVEGGLINLMVSASGTPPLTYSWKKNGTVITGANSDKLQYNPAKQTDSGTYQVTVANSAGTVLSSSALVTVNPKPDGNIFRDPAFSAPFNRVQDDNLYNNYVLRGRPQCQGRYNPTGSWAFLELSDNLYFCQNEHVEEPNGLYYQFGSGEPAKTFSSDRNGHAQIRFFTEIEKNKGCDLSIDQVTYWPHYGITQSLDSLPFRQESPFVYQAKFKLNGVNVRQDLPCASASWRGIAPDHLMLHVTFKLASSNPNVRFFYLTFPLCYSEGGDCINQYPSGRLDGDQFGDSIYFFPYANTVSNRFNKLVPVYGREEWTEMNINLNDRLATAINAYNLRYNPSIKLKLESFSLYDYENIIETWGQIKIDFEMKDLRLTRQ